MSYLCRGGIFPLILLTVGSKPKYRFIVIISISLLFVAVFLLWLRHRNLSETGQETPVVAVSAVKPEVRDLRNSITLSAVLETESRVTVVPKVSGTILEIPVEEGDEVQEGDILAGIDSEPYLLEMKAAESAWLLADSSLSRLNRIKESSGVSQQQIDEAQANRDAAYSNYELARMKYGYAEIKAPISGLILKKFSDAGNTASPNRPLFLLGDSGDPRVKVRVPEKYWGYFTNPESIRALVSYPAGGDSQTREFHLLTISPNISPENKTFEVICSIPAEKNTWPIGAGVKVELVLDERKNVWSLPLRVISVDDEIWEINPVSSEVTPIRLSGAFRDNERFALPENLSSGLFVLDGQNLLHDGQVVRAIEAER